MMMQAFKILYGRAQKKRKQETQLLSLIVCIHTIFVNRQEHVQVIRIKIKACINLMS